MIADRRGSAAVEIALLLPVLCLVLIGAYELYAYMRAVSLAERTAVTLADLLARRKSSAADCGLTTDSSYLGTYFQAAETVARPLSLPGGGMVILSAVHDRDGFPTVAWQRRTSYGLDGIASAVGAEGHAAHLPAGLSVLGGGDTAVVAEVFYDYDPFPLARAFLSSAPARSVIRRQAYFRSRYGLVDTLTAIAGCSGLPS